MPIPIVGGVRLTGKVGRHSLALLNMQTEEEERVGVGPLPGANFTMLRYSREVLRNSLIGAFLMNKARGDTVNRLFGAEVFAYHRRGPGISMQWPSNRTRPISATVPAWRTGVQYDAGLNFASVNYTSLDDRFRDDLGFIPRLQGVDITNAGYLRRWRPEATYRWVREYRPEVNYLRYTSAGNTVQSARLTPTMTAELTDTSRVVVSMARNEENLLVPFRPQGIPAGESIDAGNYRFNSGTINYTRSNNHAIAPTAEYRFGEFYDGTRNGYTVGARVRLECELSLQMREQVLAVLLVEMHRARARCRCECERRGPDLELGAPLGIIEQLAIADDGDAAVLVEDRLLTVRKA